MEREFFKNAVNIAKSICIQKICAGDTVIDATMGNGNDTQFLSELVGEAGRVYAFDIQKKAVENTREKLEKSELLQRVVLINDGHENLEKYVDNKIKLAIFNLGYLPSADHNVVTKPETTILAVEKSLNLLEKNGVVIIVIYYGHPGGMEERKAVEDYSSTLNQKEYNVVRLEFVNQKNDPPLLIVIEKR